MAGRAVGRPRHAGESSLMARERAPGSTGPPVEINRALHPDDDGNPASRDGKSYGELYVEYAPTARRLALSMVPPDVADDIVAEAFARVLAAIRAGGGPDHAFRGYLLAAVRNLANDWIAARRRVTVIGDIDEKTRDLAAGFSSAADAQAEARAEARLIVRAFSRLPERWRTVLWRLEVEGRAPAEVAPMFGLSANGVSALAMRAREGLRQAYLQEHIGTNIPAACRTYAEELGAGARGRLSPRRQAAMQAHLRQCPMCQDLFTELSELNSKLGTILAPIALAGTSAVLHAGRHTLLRAGLSAQWRSLRWHPVTAAAGAAASVAVAGGMLFAVNVTPVTGSPSHVTVQAADPAARTSDHFAGGSTPGRRGGGGGGGAGGGGAGGVLTGSGAPAGTASVGGSAGGGAPPSIMSAGVAGDVRRRDRPCRGRPGPDGRRSHHGLIRRCGSGRAGFFRHRASQPGSGCRQHRGRHGHRPDQHGRQPGDGSRRHRRCHCDRSRRDVGHHCDRSRGNRRDYRDRPG